MTQEKVLRLCDWGNCEEVASIGIPYPARVPDAPGERDGERVEHLDVCPWCAAEAALDEAKEMWRELGYDFPADLIVDLRVRENRW